MIIDWQPDNNSNECAWQWWRIDGIFLEYYASIRRSCNQAILTLAITPPSYVHTVRMKRKRKYLFPTDTQRKRERERPVLGGICMLCCRPLQMGTGNLRATSHTSQEPWIKTLWEPKIKCPKAIPTHFQNHVVWSWTVKCSVKSYVTRSSTRCYFNGFLFLRRPHTW